MIFLFKNKNFKCGLVDDSTGLRTFSFGTGYYYREIESTVSLLNRKLKKVILFWKKDKSSIERKVGSWKFFIKDWKNNAPLPPNCGIFMGASGKKIPFFHRDLNGKISYCHIKINKKSDVKQIEPDVQMWGYRARKKLITTYTVKDWWDKYKDAIMFFGSATLALVLVYLLLKKVDLLAVLGDIIKSSAETIKSSSIINTTTGAP